MNINKYIKELEIYINGNILELQNLHNELRYDKKIRQ